MLFYNVLSLVCLVQSLILVAIGGFRAHGRYKKELEYIDGDGSKTHRSIFTPFQVFLIWFFFAVVSLYLPIYRLDLDADAVVLRGIKVVLLSVQNGLRTFILDGDFYCFISFGGNPLIVDRVIGQVYNIFAAVIFVTAPFLTAGFVLSFFKNISALVKYKLSFNNEICYISELNSASLALAVNILTEKRTEDSFILKPRKLGNGGLDPIDDGETEAYVDDLLAENAKSAVKALPRKTGFIGRLGEKLDSFLRAKFGSNRPLIVFFDVHENDEEAYQELLERAKSLRCICFENDISDIGLKKNAGIKRKFYFVGLNAEENINQAISMINHCRVAEDGIYNTYNTEFYIFSTSRESEALLDMVDNGNIKVRRVNEKRNLVLNTVIDYPVFENFTQESEDSVRRMTALIIGAGNYGTELLKTLCWCGQLPNYELSVHIADKREDVESSLKQDAPELMESRANAVSELHPEEPYYEIFTHSDIDVNNDSLDKLLSDMPLPDNVFVTLGADEINVEVAMKVRSILRRRVNELGGKHPKVYTVIYSGVRNETFGNGLRVADRDDFDITFIGDIRTRFSLKVIEQDMLDKMGMMVHLGWTMRSANKCVADYAAARKASFANSGDSELEEAFKKAKEKLAKAIASIPRDKARYRKYEYYRRASIASVVHMLVMKNLGVTFSTKTEAQILEHKRWCAFMRCEGYVKQVKSGRDYVAKTHHDLRLFSNLSPEDQIKDSIELYDYIEKVKVDATDTESV